MRPPSSSNVPTSWCGLRGRVACPGSSNAEGGSTMSADALAPAVRRFFDEVWNRGNAAAAAEFLAPGFVSHNSFGIEVLGPDEYGQSVLAYRRAFPDLQTTLEDVIAT